MQGDQSVSPSQESQVQADGTSGGAPALRLPEQAAQAVIPQVAGYPPPGFEFIPPGADIPYDPLALLQLDILCAKGSHHRKFIEAFEMWSDLKYQLFYKDNRTPERLEQQKELEVTLATEYLNWAKEVIQTAEDIMRAGTQMQRDPLLQEPAPIRDIVRRKHLVLAVIGRCMVAKTMPEGSAEQQAAIFELKNAGAIDLSKKGLDRLLEDSMQEYYRSEARQARRRSVMAKPVVYEDEMDESVILAGEKARERKRRVREKKSVVFRDLPAETLTTRETENELWMVLSNDTQGRDRVQEQIDKWIESEGWQELAEHQTPSIAALDICRQISVFMEMWFREESRVTDTSSLLGVDALAIKIWREEIKLTQTIARYATLLDEIGNATRGIPIDVLAELDGAYREAYHATEQRIRIFNQRREAWKSCLREVDAAAKAKAVADESAKIFRGFIGRTGQRRSLIEGLGITPLYNLKSSIPRPIGFGRQWPDEEEESSSSTEEEESIAAVRMPEGETKAIDQEDAEAGLSSGAAPRPQPQDVDRDGGGEVEGESAKTTIQEPQ